MEKNSLKPEQVKHLGLFAALVEAQDQNLITRDVEGMVHFSSHLRNIQDVNQALETLKRQSRYEKLVEEESEKVRDIIRRDFPPRSIHRPLRDLLRLRRPGQHLLAHGLQAAAGHPGNRPSLQA